MATQTMKVTVRNGTITVDKNPVEVGLNETPKLVWRIDKDSYEAGWRFALDGIDIHQDDVSFAVLHERDRRLMARLLKELDPKAAAKVGKMLAKGYDRVLKPARSRAKQFTDPLLSPNGREFSWKDRNALWEVYKYTINVTNGQVALSWDPAIQNQGC